MLMLDATDVGLPESDSIRPEPVRVFVSYARTKKGLRETFTDSIFDAALDPITDVWVDDEIGPGARWESEIRERLLRADVVFSC